jgi:hypothetical protein
MTGPALGMVVGSFGILGTNCFAHGTPMLVAGYKDCVNSVNNDPSRLPTSTSESDNMRAPSVVRGNLTVPALLQSRLWLTDNHHIRKF